MPPTVIAVSLPITCAATCVTTSGMTGFTFPGMIELPFWSSGRTISARPARGPEPLPERDGDGVHPVRPARLDDIVELTRLCRERLGKPGKRRQQVVRQLV